ncbi:techylectin-5B-like [Limulus polyphemus]|uniref:Techylectin-5B-like n=1 Tax=Limulus polyphemus TaxID=6850 RepID=A0ABM1BYE0_LIMPO|nr:techylectin-5B-like [Limulus polyphemus]
MYNTVKILSILSVFVLTQADVHHHTACNTVGSLKGIVDSVTELVDLARERISTLEDVFSTNTLERTLPLILNDKQNQTNRAFQQSPSTLLLMSPYHSIQRSTDSKTVAESYRHRWFGSLVVYRYWHNLLLIQRRGDFGKPVENFYRTWEEYKNGFGNLTKEFWLGNDIIFSLTNQNNMVLRVDLEDFEGVRRYAEHDEFLIRSEIELYKMSFKTYKGDAGNSLTIHNNMMFSTKDKDNDKNSGSCAQSFKGGWWYNSCHRSKFKRFVLHRR